MKKILYLFLLLPFLTQSQIVFDFSNATYYTTSIGNQGISQSINGLTVYINHTNSSANLTLENGYVFTNFESSSNEILITYSREVNLKSNIISSKDGSNVRAVIEHFREDNTFVVRNTLNGIEEDFILSNNYNQYGNIKYTEVDFERNNWKIGEIIIHSFTPPTPIIQSNFQDAINTCLGIDPINGDCTSSEYGAIKDWDVSQVTDMREAFKLKTSFNGDISNWDTSNVTDMYGMFDRASTFNQDLSGWCVTNITSEPSYFAENAALSEDNKPVWGSCPDTSLSVNDPDVSNISMYPNPVVDRLFIEGLSDASKVSIYNILGKLVVSKTTSKEIDVDNLQSGIYIVKIIDQQKEIVKKFIKK